MPTYQAGAQRHFKTLTRPHVHVLAAYTPMHIHRETETLPPIIHYAFHRLTIAHQHIGTTTVRPIQLHLSRDRDWVFVVPSQP